MVSVALDPAYRRVSVAEFLAMDLGGAKAELEDGLIFMMAGGNAAHARIATNIIIALGLKLRGSGCRPFNSDFAVRTAEQTVRFPDVSVYRDNPGHPANDSKQLLGDPKIIFEVLSASPASHDQKVKLSEYLGLPGLDELVFVDPQTERIRHIRRTGPAGWADDWLDAGADLTLGSIGITLSAVEVFARD